MRHRRVCSGKKMDNDNTWMPYWVIGMLFVVLLIVFAQTMFSPVHLERYNMDVYWLLSIFSFLVFGFHLKDHPKYRFWSSLLGIYAYLMSLQCILLYFVPNDRNFAYYASDAVRALGDCVLFFCTRK